jgi:hypothetical protein
MRDMFDLLEGGLSSWEVEAEQATVISILVRAHVVFGEYLFDQCALHRLRFVLVIMLAAMKQLLRNCLDLSVNERVERSAFAFVDSSFVHFATAAPTPKSVTTS